MWSVILFPFWEYVLDEIRLELILLNKIDGVSCTANRTDDSMCKTFGNRAILCNLGECRCDGIDSFPNEAVSRCGKKSRKTRKNIMINALIEAPLDKPLADPKEQCPLESTLQGNTCRCKDGYYSSADSNECRKSSWLNISHSSTKYFSFSISVRHKAQLINYAGTPQATGDLDNADCRTIFGVLAEAYSSDQCQCRNDSFVWENGMECRKWWFTSSSYHLHYFNLGYKLNVTITQTPNSILCPPDSDFRIQPVCQCNNGFQRNGDKCGRHSISKSFVFEYSWFLFKYQ